MLTCIRTRRRLGAYLDRALEPSAVRTIETHLAACPRCQREIEQLRKLQSLLRPTATVAEPDWTGFWPGIVRGIQDRRTPAPVPSRARWWWHPRVALGGAVAALALSLTLWQLSPTLFPAQAPLLSSAHTDLPDSAVMVYATPERDMTVVWLFEK